MRCVLSLMLEEGGGGWAWKSDLLNKHMQLHIFISRAHANGWAFLRSAFVNVFPSDVKCINCLGFSLIFHFTTDSGDK